MSFGGFQPSQEFKDRKLPPTHGSSGRFPCPFEACEENMLSDEALQLHRILHELFIIRNMLQFQGEKKP